MKKYILLLLASAAFLSCTPTQTTDLKTGDLLFVTGEDNMDKAVAASTGEYTHVAILVCKGDSVFVIDATPRHGVSQRPLAQFISELSADHKSMQAMRLTIPFDTAQVVSLGKARIGLAFDSMFLPDNNAYYCSELVYDCYRSADGTPLFTAQPMINIISKFCDVSQKIKLIKTATQLRRCFVFLYLYPLA